jgi:protein-S-isoprenylcysteine O-methyltransferase Ste14
LTDQAQGRLEPPRSRGARIFFHLLASVAVASLYAYYVQRDFRIITGAVGGPGSGRQLAAEWFELLTGPTLLSLFLLLIRNSLLTFFFISRKLSKETSAEFMPWAAAVGGTLIGYFFVPAPTTSPALVMAGGWIMVIGVLLAIIAVSSLGRSFGIVPSNRGIRTGGFYRLVRHPAYGTYFIIDLGFVLVHPTLRNGLVFIAFIMLSYYRSVFEEQLLMGDPDYVAYRQTVRWRFIPGIW